MKSKELGLPLFYQEYPEFFDNPNSLHMTQKNEVVAALLKKYKVHHVLDMTCGTGAQVFYLAERGYEVVGSDFSLGLLKIARERAAAAKLNVPFHEGDMRSARLGAFDAVITIDNAIGHLIKEDFEIALQNISHNLKEGGFYIFDILNLEAMTHEVVKADAQKMTNKREASDGTIIHNERSSWVDRVRGLITSENKFTFEKEGVEKKVQNRCSLQIYTMSQLEKILSRNGFEILEQYKIDTYTFQKDEAGYGLMNVAQKKI